MKVSIVVPAFNEESELPGSLASIRTAMAAFAARGWDTELIVCDNNSTDRTAEIARAAGAAVVFERINQISRARNAGAAHATGDWLVFVDADSQPTRGLFADVANAIAGGVVLAGGATIASVHPRRAVRVVTRTWNLISRVTRWAAGSFVFCEAAAFRAVGGFSLEYFAGEEIDLFTRLKRLARSERRTIVILDRHPLQTSDRKVRLYTWKEALIFHARTLVKGRRAFRSQEDCFFWYDGRR
jgi:glycosyltransferase involved in cell wall biosynthesis